MALAVAVLGTGIMGAPMARNLAGAGPDVRAWNRTAEKAQPLAEHGVTVAEDAADAVRGADVALTMLADAEATLAVGEQALGALDGEAIWLQAGTIGIEGTGRCAEAARRAGASFVDGPVLGTRQPAEDGALIVLAAGPDAALDRCAPVFDAIGQRTLRVGSEPGAASRLKLVLNAWVLAVTQGTAEMIALAEGLGLDPQQALDALDGGPLDLPYLRVKGGMMMAGEFPPSFPLSLAAKDAALVAGAAQRAGVDLPLARAVAERYAQAREAGLGDEDMAATYRLSRPSSG
jgi:3-hydroxyisobutyrate dehydrogenase